MKYLLIFCFLFFSFDVCFGKTNPVNQNLQIQIQDKEIKEKNRIVGFPKIISGDTFMFGELRIKIYGIKAPNLNETCSVGRINYRCGLAAKEHLERLVAEYVVFCEPISNKMVYPIMAHCYLGDQNLSHMMLALGWVIVDRNCGDYCEKYLKESYRAERSGRGLFQGPLPESLIFKQKKQIKVKNKSIKFLDIQKSFIR